jgi:FkbM family methyltransferase
VNDAKPFDSLNSHHHDALEAERCMLREMLARGVTSLLDVGANAGGFGYNIRKLGYRGLLLSVEPQTACRAPMLKSTSHDVKWIYLPNQGLGAEPGVMALNVSANSYSSSFLPVHENHTGAEPTTRAVRSENVYVNRADKILQPAILAEIGAIKIDTQGFELEVLRGLGTAFANASVMLAELSAVECYTGAPTMAEVDSYITEKLGFRRVSLTPTYVDGRDGTVQQYDGIYVRDLPQGQITRHWPGIDIDAVVTSMGEALRRPDAKGQNWGLNWEQSCVAAMTRFAPEVISVSDHPVRGGGMRHVAVSAPPSLADVIGAATGVGARHVMIAPIDVLLSESLHTHLPRLDAGVVYVSQNFLITVDPARPQELKPLGADQLDYGFCLVPQAFLQALAAVGTVLPAVPFRGPLWTLAVVLLAHLHGFPVKRLIVDPPLALHFQHAPEHFDQHIESVNAFEAWLESLLAGGASPLMSLLAEALRLADQHPHDSVKRVGEVCRFLFRNAA